MMSRVGNFLESSTTLQFESSITLAAVPPPQRPASDCPGSPQSHRRGPSGHRAAQSCGGPVRLPCRSPPHRPQRGGHRAAQSCGGPAPFSAARAAGAAMCICITEQCNNDLYLYDVIIILYFIDINSCCFVSIIIL